jgi:hypothetical protein
MSYYVVLCRVILNGQNDINRSLFRAALPHISVVAVPLRARKTTMALTESSALLRFCELLREVNHRFCIICVDFSNGVAF